MNSNVRRAVPLRSPQRSVFGQFHIACLPILDDMIDRRSCWGGCACRHTLIPRLTRISGKGWLSCGALHLPSRGFKSSDELYIMPKAGWLECGVGSLESLPQRCHKGPDLVTQDTANKWAVAVDRILDVDGMIEQCTCTMAEIFNSVYSSVVPSDKVSV